MKVTTFFSIAVLAALAQAASTIQLFINDAHKQQFNHAGLSSIHEGAAINYFQVGVGAETLIFDEDAGTVFTILNDAEGNEHYLYLDVLDADDGGFPVLETTPSLPSIKWKVTNGYLRNEEGDELTFYVAKNIGDPYRYSQTNYFVGAAQEGATFNEPVSDVYRVFVTVTYV